MWRGGHIVSSGSHRICKVPAVREKICVLETAGGSLWLEQECKIVNVSDEAREVRRTLIMETWQGDCSQKYKATLEAGNESAALPSTEVMILSTIHPERSQAANVEMSHGLVMRGEARVIKSKR